jgi:hypothetical protein
MPAVHKDASKRSYIAVAAFHANIFSYTTSMVNHVMTGDLAVLAAADATNCPKGRVLRENGRKLFPGVHADVGTYMIGVYDAESFLSGFIDPNSPLFAAYRSDAANFVADGINPVGGLKDNGAPVYTNGSVEAAKFNVSGFGTSAASVGTATTASNTVVVNTTAVTASSLIFVTSTTGTASYCSVDTIVNGVSFTISSSSAVDTMNWLIIN